MVDIHTHILPGLDDGADSWETAVKMARLAENSGVNHVVTSSHGNYYGYTLGEYKEAFGRLQRILKERQISVTLYPGMEIFLDDDVPDLLAKKQLLSLNGTNYLLVEFPFEESVGNVCRRIGTLQKMQYRVILAHPERYLFIQKDLELAYYLAEQGCVLQVNLGSLTGDFGRQCRKMAIQMLDDSLVRVLATDAHDTRYRTNDVREGLKFLKKHYPSRDIRLWLSENPSRIIKGLPTLGLTAEEEFNYG